MVVAKILTDFTNMYIRQKKFSSIFLPTGYLSLNHCLPTKIGGVNLKTLLSIYFLLNVQFREFVDFLACHVKRCVLCGRESKS